MKKSIFLMILVCIFFSVTCISDGQAETQFLHAANNAQTSLSESLDESDTTMVALYGGGASFPSTYPYHLCIGTITTREIVKVTNRSNDTFTIMRGQEGTAAVVHPIGSFVRLNITAKYVEDLNAAVNTLENSVAGYMTGNNPITPGTGTKISVDSKGLVTSIQNLLAADLPTHTHLSVSQGGVYPWAYITGFDTYGTSTLVLRADKPLDTMTAPSDNTNLNASTSAHGLMPKLSGNASYVFRGDGTQGPPPVGTQAPHPLVGSVHTVTGLTTGYFMRALSPNTYGFEAVDYEDVGAAADDHIQSVGSGGTGITEAPLLGQSIVGDGEGGYTLVDLDFQPFDLILQGIAESSPEEGTVLLGTGEGFDATPLSDIGLSDLGPAETGSVLNLSTTTRPGLLSQLPSSNGASLFANGLGGWSNPSSSPEPHDGATFHTSIGASDGQVLTADGVGGLAFEYPVLPPIQEEDLPLHPFLNHYIDPETPAGLFFKTTATGVAGFEEHGIQGVTEGGTGISTAPTEGQLLVGNSQGGYTLGVLTASSVGAVASNPTINPGVSSVITYDNKGLVVDSRSLVAADIPSLAYASDDHNHDDTYADIDHTHADNFVPYTGADADVDLGSHAFSTTGNVTVGALVVENAFGLPIVDGTNGQTLITNGEGTISWGTIEGGTGSSSVNYLPLPIENVKTGTTLFTVNTTAGFDPSNAVNVIIFTKDATYDKSCEWSDIIPPGYTSDKTLYFDMLIAPRYSQSSKDAKFSVSIMAVTEGDSESVFASGFDTANVLTIANLPATAGYTKLATATLSNKDSVAAGDIIRIRLTFNGSDAASTCSDVYGLKFKLRWE